LAGGSGRAQEDTLVDWHLGFDEKLPGSWQLGRSEQPHLAWINPHDVVTAKVEIS